MKILYISLLLYFASNFVFANSITCTHQQICHLVTYIHGNAAVKKIPHSGDHHHHDLRTKDIKPLYDARYLITAPIQLQPWLNKIHSTKVDNLAFTPTIAKKYLKQYQTSNIHTIAHFWLYPKIYCDIYQQIVETLKHWHLTVKRKNCNNQFFDDWNKISLAGHTIILTHDALLPLLRSQGAKVFTLRRSHHHHGVSSKVLKNLQDFLKNNPQNILWVFEKNINIPSIIKDWIKPEHRKVNLNLMGSPLILKENPLAILGKALQQK